MNYSGRGDKTGRREGAQPRTGAGRGNLPFDDQPGPGLGRSGGRQLGARALGAREKLGLIRGGGGRPARAICQTPGLGAITGPRRGCGGSPRAQAHVGVCASVCLHAHV